MNRDEVKEFARQIDAATEEYNAALKDELDAIWKEDQVRRMRKASHERFLSASERLRELKRDLAIYQPNVDLKTK